MMKIDVDEERIDVLTGEEKQTLMRLLLKFLWEEKWFILFLFVIGNTYLFCGLFLWTHFTWEAWYSLFVVLLTFSLLLRNTFDASLVMMLSTTLLLCAGIINEREAIEGFGNAGIFCIAVLFIVAASIASTGSLTYLTKYVFGQPRNLIDAQMRLMIPVGLVSAFINNTPLVAMMIPAVEKWSRTSGVSASKLMIPLSYAAILGGTLTIIGTSTNLIVVGLVQRVDPTIDFPFFEVGYIGGPVFGIGVAYMLLCSWYLLPDNKGALNSYVSNPEQYVLSVTVQDQSSVIGKTIEEAGLRHLKGMFLVEIQREESVLPAISHDTVLNGGDHLLFAGNVEQVGDIFSIRGLTKNKQENDLLAPSPNRILVEAIVSPGGKLVNKTARELGFRELHDAAIVSIYRDGSPLHQKIGDVKLIGSDLLLLVARPSFLEKHETTSDFLLVTQVLNEDRWEQQDQPKSTWKMILAPTVATAMIVLNAMEVVSLLKASLAAAFFLILVGCISWDEVRQACNIPVMVTICASFGLATALEHTGVAHTFADNLMSLTRPAGDIGLLYGVYLSTALLTALLSNASAAAIMVPIAFSLREEIAVKAMMYVIMVGASADLSTPIGYQTNLMVWGPGGYRFFDYTKVGFPLQVILSFVSVGITYLLFTDPDSGPEQL
eukprot:TRINITY_DN12196_c0_g1_i1.p1 TRINITY_DN12196_c0_g1~~TRINITY_DN12196_c0_g1_i1.p1  ORF type:complete len:661 (+),score=164.81 TRINITY_DN12196_c0_g1_i1:136-2118(+)